MGRATPRWGSRPAFAFLFVSCFWFLVSCFLPAQTGPQTEKRFPPLKVPEGFKATLFACDPLIEYPSVIAAGPRPGAVFVAHDYVTGLGVDIVRRDEIRLVEDTDHDGYADNSTVYAKGFNSIQGLAYHGGTMYVMHAPLLTALRDTKGTGVADERRDLLTGLGLPPEENSNRLHCANGVVVGHDGWLYLALGDRGCRVKRPEGDELVFNGGGILRCRPDGRDLHVFARGLRNIYDVALDADLNVFVRDNENDGGTYKIRVCHSFFGADHGYPYLYYEHADEALAPLADLGLGSSAGGVCYLEQQFPPPFRGNLFFCEWGRSVVRYPLRAAGSSFAPVTEIEFAAGADNDPYGFKPTDIVVQRDGTLLVSDWADGQRPRRGRGRIYHIRWDKPADGQFKGLPPPAQDAARLDAESYYERCEAQAALESQGRDDVATLLESLKQGRIGVRGRLHAVWVLAKAGAEADLFRLAEGDADMRVRVQAVRALADLVDPVLRKRRLDAGPGDTAMAKRLGGLAGGEKTPLLREVIIALGRLRWPDAADWLRRADFQSAQSDPALAHAAMQTLRQSRNWPAILKLLDGPEPLRSIALRSLAEVAEPAVVDGLIERLSAEKDAAWRRRYADTLSRVYKKPGPWTYWGFRPPPRPANPLAWERTDAIAAALDRSLADIDVAVRVAVLQGMQRFKVPIRPEPLTRWLKSEREADRVGAILESLREQPSASRAELEAIVRDKGHSVANRLTALRLFAKSLDRKSWLSLAKAIEDGPVLAETIRQAPNRIILWEMDVAEFLTKSGPEVRATIIEVVVDRQARVARDWAVRYLEDPEPRVRQAAVLATARIKIVSAADTLLKLTRDADPAVRADSFDALRLLGDARALELAIKALSDRQTAVKALQYLGDLGGPDQAAALVEMAKHSPSPEVVALAIRVLDGWQNKDRLPRIKWAALDRVIAQVHGASGIIGRWRVKGSNANDADAVVKSVSGKPNPDESPDFSWHASFATGMEGRVTLEAGPADGVWLAVTDVIVAEATPVQFLASSSGNLRVWLNGKPLLQRERVETYALDSDRFAGTLEKGSNRLLVQVAAVQPPRVFHLRFRRQSGSAEHERLMQKALASGGNVERGRKLFFDVEKSLCLKCHLLGDKGERVGPEMTGIGSRFSRVYIAESILEPNRTIAPSFGTVAVVLKNGKTFSGVKIADTPTTLTLVDNQGQKHTLTKSDIEDQQAQPVSTMPEGFEKRITAQEFVDLIEFLVSQKENRAARTN